MSYDLAAGQSLEVLSEYLGRTAKPDPSDPNTQAKPRAAVLQLHMINIDEFKKLSPFFTVKQYTRVIHHWKADFLAYTPVGSKNLKAKIS